MNEDTFRPVPTLLAAKQQHRARVDDAPREEEVSLHGCLVVGRPLTDRVSQAANYYS